MNKMTKKELMNLSREILNDEQIEKVKKNKLIVNYKNLGKVKNGVFRDSDLDQYELYEFLIKDIVNEEEKFNILYIYSLSKNEDK